MAVASAGPYASLHLAPDRQPRQHPTTLFFTGRMPFLPPNQQRQSTEGTEQYKLKLIKSDRPKAAGKQIPDTLCIDDAVFGEMESLMDDDYNGLELQHIITRIEINFAVTVQ